MNFESADGRRVTTATGQTTRIRGEIEIPFTIRHRTKPLRVCALPTLALPCIIGIDALSLFGIGVDFATHRWWFKDAPNIEYAFDERCGDQAPRANAAEGAAAEPVAAPAEAGPALRAVECPSQAALSDTVAIPKRARTRRPRNNPPLCCGLVEMSATEEQRLTEFLASEIGGDSGKPGITSLTEHKIDVGGHAPIKQRYYPVSPKIQEAIYAEVDKMLEDDVIEPSKSEWSTPIVMIKKSNGTYRFCLDFRRLNSVSKKDAYPLPYMNAI
ncbi:PREDICTED: uncharacterized protein LOC105563055 [Vollenhovia emeryi]|uniref:uncharacterized protein LOC105563055 n=1 Tax=Vollenhovia emeryi TaxID=411798 RepID=UPI0005F40A96|nr:PREDICTED: uncharacterized protein LOC105563055 [Vollenhovia emeryi]